MPDSEAMTIAEGRELGRLEPVVHAGLAAFGKVEAKDLTAMRAGWMAIFEIRDRRLYKAAAKNFEVYCRETFDKGRRQIDRYIAFGKMELSPTGLNPANERQARELSGHPLKAQQTVMEALQGQATAQTIRQGLLDDAEQTRLEEADALKDKPPRAPKQKNLGDARKAIEGKLKATIKIFGQNVAWEWAADELTLFLKKFQACPD